MSLVLATVKQTTFQDPTYVKKITEKDPASLSVGTGLMCLFASETSPRRAGACKPWLLIYQPVASLAQ